MSAQAMAMLTVFGAVVTAACLAAMVTAKWLDRKNHPKALP